MNHKKRVSKLPIPKDASVKRDGDGFVINNKPDSLDITTIKITDYIEYCPIHKVMIIEDEDGLQFYLNPSSARTLLYNFMMDGQYDVSSDLMDFLMLAEIRDITN